MIIETITDPKLLFAELAKVSEPEERFRIKYRLAYVLLGRAPKRSFQVVEDMERLAEQIGTDKAMGMTLTAKARYYQRTGDYEEALSIYEKAITLLNANDVYIEKAKALDGMGMVLSYVGEPEKAIASSKEAIKYFELGKDPLGMKANCMNNIGNAYGRRGQREKAVEYYQKALKVVHEYGQEKNSTHIRANMAIELNLIGRSEEAIVEFTQCYDEFAAKGNKAGMALSMLNTAICHSALGEYGEAIELFIRSILDLKQLDDRKSLADAHAALGKTYFLMKGYHEAVNELQEGIAMYKSIGFIHGEVESLLLLGDMYKALSKDDLATDMWQRAMKISKAKDLTGFLKEATDRLAGIA